MVECAAQGCQAGWAGRPGQARPHGLSTILSSSGESAHLLASSSIAATLHALLSPRPERTCRWHLLGRPKRLMPARLNGMLH